MLRESGAVRKNYQGIDIPVSAGLTFPLAVMAVVLVFILLGDGRDYLYFLLGLTAISF